MKRNFVIIVSVSVLFSACYRNDNTYVAPYNYNNTSQPNATLGGPVNTLGIYNGNLVAGAGNGVIIHGLSNVAQWNGSAWSALGKSFYGGVYSQAVYGGNLVVAGQFDSTVGVKAQNIAQWNGTSWSSLGGGLHGGPVTVYALAVFNGKLFAAGLFDSAGTIAANNIAQWNDTVWTSVDSGVNGTVFSLIVYNASLVAGGNFTTLSGKIKYIAQYNGSLWSALASDITGNVGSMTVYNGNLIAFAASIDNTNNSIAQWNGSSWNIIGKSFNDGVSSMVVYNGNLLIGYYNENSGSHISGLDEWNGSAWPTLNSFSNPNYTPYIYALTVYKNNLILGGHLPSTNGVIEYNGSTWSGF